MKKNKLTRALAFITAMLILATTMITMLTGCGSETESDTQSTESAEETLTKFDYSTLNAADYIVVGDYTDASLCEEMPEDVTDADVDSELSSNLESYPVYEKVLKGEAGKKDSVNIDYVASIDNTEVASGSDVEISISDEDTLEDVASSLLGRTPGEQYKINSTFSDDYEGTYTNADGDEADLAGESAEFFITVNYIYGDAKTIENVTDDDISTLTSETYNSIEEFREYLKEQLESSRQTDALEDIWNNLIESCSIISGKEEEVDEIVESEYEYATTYYEQMAESYGTDFATLAVNYGYDTEDEFKESIRSDSENIVKHYLIAYYIADKEGLILSDEDFETKESELAEDYGYAEVSDFEEVYGNTEIKLYLQLDEVDGFLAEKILGVEKTE